MAALGVVVVVAGLATIEGAASAWLMFQDVRGIRFDENLRPARYDSLLGWAGIPNIHRVSAFGPTIVTTHNADGMRIHHPVTPALAPGERRAICSGDSFTNGWGVADGDTFCADLERSFPGLQTLNMAQPGYGIDQMYLWYKRDAVRWPHQVHLFAFIWNDFERMAMRSFLGTPKPILRLRGDSLVVENVPVPRTERSPKWTVAAGYLPRLRIVQLVQRRMDMSERTKLARTDAQVWSIAEAVFKDLDRLNRARGSQLVLVYLPTLSDLTPGPYDNRRKHLAAFAERAKIPLIDLTSDIRREPPDSSQWYFITPHQLNVAGAGGHYSARGNQWVAAHLAERMRGIPSVAAALTPSAGAPR